MARPSGGSYQTDSRRVRLSVHSRGATPEGVMDMAGNIWEWTVDKSLRGGPWCERPEWQRCDFVAREDEFRTDDKFGLRVVMEIR